MSVGRLYEFGPFRLDAGGRLLFREGQRLALSPKAVELLVVLVEAQANRVGKEELLNKVWADTAVEEGSLTSHISLLRKTLGEQYIETIPKRGYRFVATVKQLSEPSEAPQQIRSLAVLPLENLGRDPDGDCFADSMTEALITNLAKISALRVVSRTSVMLYKNTRKSIPEIGRELRVDALMEGSVQCTSNRVRINARLVSAAADQHLWAEVYDRDLRDVLILQDEVARAIAKEIQVKLTPEEHARLSSSPTVDPDAYQLYIKGRYFWVRRNEQSFQHAIAYFQQAIERDPNYAAAHSGLADCYSSLGFSFDVGSQRPCDVQPKAKNAALKAIALDDSLAEAHNSLAYVKLNYEWDWAGAEAEFKRSLELNPGYAHAHHWYAHLLLSGGRLREALAESDRALDLDPLSPIMNLHLGWHYLYAREYDKAIDQFAKTLELDGNYGLAYWYRGLAFEQKGMYGEAMRDLGKAKGLLAENLSVHADMGRIRALSGHPEETGKAIEKLKQKSKKNYVNPYQLALIHIGLGDNEQAFELLDKAFRERSDMLVYLKADFRLDPIRNDSRFMHLGRKVGIPES
jgi:TolB-like protein/Tfp pilus assembly protein PilF